MHDGANGQTAKRTQVRRLEADQTAGTIRKGTSLRKTFSKVLILLAYVSHACAVSDGRVLHAAPKPLQSR